MEYIYSDINVLQHETDDDIREYQRFLRNRKERTHLPPVLAYNPQFSVVIPVVRERIAYLKECMESVLNQSYEYYEIILAIDSTCVDGIVGLAEYENDPHIRILKDNTIQSIKDAVTLAVQSASGEYIVFVSCGDLIEEDALYAFAELLNVHAEYDYIYSDEDWITAEGMIRHLPFFKPDWSPDLFRNLMYTGHMAAYRSSLIIEIGDIYPEGVLGYDMTLRFLERTDNNRIGHIANILYHNREYVNDRDMHAPPINKNAQKQYEVMQSYLKRNHIAANLVENPHISGWHVLYDVVGEPLVSIIIPSRDNYGMLRKCIESVDKHTNYKHYEIIVVDNGSNNENRIRVERYLSDKNIVYIYDRHEFNFSRMCNTGRYYSRGDYLLFLNDDIEIAQEGWLECMLGQAEQGHAGAVGAKLLYPGTNMIQHAGISNTKEGPCHNFIGCDDNTKQYYSWNHLDYNCLAVTGACLMVAAEKFDQVGGFEERLPIAYNDVWLCFSLYEKGYYNVVRNDVIAYHHESISRGKDSLNMEKRMRLEAERKRLNQRFTNYHRRDPFLNPNLESYNSGLNLAENYDHISCIQPLEVIAKGELSIDYRDAFDYIQVNACLHIDCISAMEDYEFYLVFVDPYNQYYEAPVIMSGSDKEEDGAKGVGYRFEGKIRKCELALNLVSYRIGLYLFNQGGDCYIAWQNTTELQTYSPDHFFSNQRRIIECDRYGCNVKAVWGINDLSNADGVWCAEGFAFVYDRPNYNYNRTILLVGRNNAFEYSVEDRERLDIACAFPQYPFITESGFSLRILEDELEKGETYRIFMRFANKYDDNDINDVELERVICL